MSGMENVSVKEHKGSYGDAKNTSANGLYKNYKKYVESQGKTPLPFPAWISWATEKGLLPSNFNANSKEGAKENKEESMKPMAEAVKSPVKTIGIVLGIVAVLFIGYKVLTPTETK